MTEKQKQAIKEAIKDFGYDVVVDYARDQRDLEKWCPKCEKVLSSDKFYTRERKLKNGEIKKYLYGYCIECAKKKSRNLHK